MLRKRSDELNVMILEMYKLGTKPSHIESKIKEEYPDVLIKREDIYNEIRGYKRKLKKQNSRFGFHNPSRISAAQYRKKAAARCCCSLLKQWHKWVRMVLILPMSMPLPQWLLLLVLMPFTRSCW